MTIVIILFLPNCKKEIQEGYVYRKEFRSSTIGYESEKVTKVRNKGRSVTTINKTHKVKYPDRWVLYIHTESPKITNDSALFYVDKELFEQTDIGTWFVFDESKGQRKEPYTKIN